MATQRRADQFKNIDLENFAGLIDNINRVQGSADSLIFRRWHVSRQETIPVSTATR